MKKLPERLTRTAIVAVALGSAALLVGGPLLANHAWSTYHWSRSGAQIAPPVGDNVSAQWDGYLQTAVADWNQSIYIQSPLVAGQTSPRNCRPKAGRIEVCNSTYGNTGWLGVATSRSHDRSVSSEVDVFAGSPRRGLRRMRG